MKELNQIKLKTRLNLSLDKSSLSIKLDDFIIKVEKNKHRFFFNLLNLAPVLVFV